LLGVAFVVTQAGAANLPVFGAAGVTNAASYASGTVSRGEIVSIFGTNLGPALPAGATLDSNGLVSKQIANTLVLSDGVPAAMVYALGESNQRDRAL